MTQTLGERAATLPTAEDPAVEGTVVIPQVDRDHQFPEIFGEGTDACKRYAILRNLGREATGANLVSAVIDAQPGEFSFKEPSLTSTVPPLSIDDRFGTMPDTFTLLIGEQPRISSPPPQELWGFPVCTKRLMAHIGALTADKCVERDSPRQPVADMYTGMEAEVDLLLAQVVEAKERLLAPEPDLPIFTQARAKGTFSWFN